MVLNGFHHVGAGLRLLDFQTRAVLPHRNIVTIGLLLKAVVQFTLIAQGDTFGEILLQDLVLQMPEAVGRDHFLQETDAGARGVDLIARVPLVEN